MADAIFTGDWHLRDSKPTCRTDDFEKEQWKKVEFISSLQRKYQCPVYHSGDLFHHWKPSPYLLSRTMEHLPKNFYTIYGNHDLPNHSINEQDKCGIFVLKKAGRLRVLSGVHWGETPTEGMTVDINGRSILIWHVMNWQGVRPWPGCTDPRAGALLRKYPNYDCILTGHNHKTFVETLGERVLVNPGAITRQAADQIDFHPKVYLYHSNTNTVESIHLPVVSGVITRAHIENEEERNNRITAFVSQLTGEWEASLNFEKNLEKFFQTNTVRNEIKQIIYESLDG